MSGSYRVGGSVDWVGCGLGGIRYPTKTSASHQNSAIPQTDISALPLSVTKIHVIKLLNASPNIL